MAGRARVSSFVPQRGWLIEESIHEFIDHQTLYDSNIHLDSYLAVRDINGKGRVIETTDLDGKKPARITSGVVRFLDLKRNFLLHAPFSCNSIDRTPQVPNWLRL